MKKFLGASAALLVASSAAFGLQMPYFSGYAGFLSDIYNTKNSDAMALKVSAETFFSGQLDFGGNLLLRGEFYMQAKDLFGQNIFKDPDEPNSFFRLEEISATYKIGTLNSTHYLSAFLGNFEPAGSDIFIQRQFGVAPITSMLTESWHGLSGASVYPFYGGGLAYVLHPQKPFALEFSLYNNEQIKNAGTSQEINRNAINTDFRIATVLPKLTLDFSAGLAFPIDKTDDAGNKVILIIREVQFHTGINMLIGDRHMSSFFMQAGFNKLTLNPSATVENTNKLSFSDLYFLLEPRLMLRNCTINITAFNIPTESADDMLYLKGIVTKDETINNLLGMNLCVVSDNLYLGNTNVTFGIHGTFFFTDSDLEDAINDFQSVIGWNKEFLVTPFIKFPVFGGTLNGAVSVSCLELASDWKSAIQATVGFRSQL